MPLNAKPKLVYWLVLGAIGMTCLLIILLFGSVDQDAINDRYNTPFKGYAPSGGSLEESRFNQRGVGMSESNIRKLKGRHYETY